MLISIIRFWVAVLATMVLTPTLGAATDTVPISTIAAQLQRMNNADCAAAKRGDSKYWISTLAPEYVTIEASGVRTRYKDLIALPDQPAENTVTSCSTTVSSVKRNGERYFLYGDYREEGIILKGHRHYRLLERIRDTWKRAGSQWKQTQSLSYEYTAWIDGRLAEHRVLSNKAIREAG